MRLPRMKRIAAGESSFDVALLHKVLDVLGQPVTGRELSERKAGSETRKRVRALQEQLNVRPTGDDVLDTATISAVQQALVQSGLTEPARSFTVSGEVRDAGVRAKRRHRLLAFDIDLRAVAVYRDVKTVAELEESGGIEFLAQTESDANNRYSVTFFDWQFARAERNKADVVVYAVDERGGRIVGRSRLVSASDYEGTGVVRQLHVIIDQPEEGTEYERLMAVSTPFLKESDISLPAIATSFDQLRFTADELEIEIDHVAIAAHAALLAASKYKGLSHELLYGIGRQNINLGEASLSERPDEELKAAIDASGRANIIRTFSEREVSAFLGALRERTVAQVLADEDPNSLGAMLVNALPKEAQRAATLRAMATFDGESYAEFWSQHLPSQPELKSNPQLVADLLLTQQLTLLTENHQPLVAELRKAKVRSVHDLFDLDEKDWISAVRKSGIPDSAEGADDDEKARNFTMRMRSDLDAAFPTLRIARMLEKGDLQGGSGDVSRYVSKFLTKNAQFDFATSRIHDFDGQLRSEAGDSFPAVRDELLSLQRIYQVSPTPRAMTALRANGLTSAYSIANIPRKSFMNTYAAAVGGEQEAFVIHERASHIAARAERAALVLRDYTHGYGPRTAYTPSDRGPALSLLQKKIPNYTELFGSPDICECEHCRSVYSAAAYMVDLLRFLWRGEPNADGSTPLDMLARRRPDLLHLPLTCENTNTIIPYIDLANEVMEYYTVHDSLTNYQGHDTGDATPEELRAAPQKTNAGAYGKLAAAKYPFTLPYHQPLDVIRTYSDHLGVSRHGVMKAVNPTPNATTAQAIAAESVRVAQEEHRILAGHDFAATADATALHLYYGYGAANQLNGAAKVPEFLHRSGLRYVDLVEVVKTQFINPYQDELQTLQKIFAGKALTSTTFGQLVKIESGTLNPANDLNIAAALAAYNVSSGPPVTAADFDLRIKDNLDNIRKVLTLFEPDSKCDLETTRLRTIQSIVSNSADPGISNELWSKLHRFIRLWRKLGWTIHEVDLMLAALGENDITPLTIRKLEHVLELKAVTKLPVNQLAALWGAIETYGAKSLYRKLFLGTGRQVDDAFKPDGWGQVLQDGNEKLANHRSAIVGAFRLRDVDLEAILKTARVIDNGQPRAIDFDNDPLTLGNLTTIYRYALLAKATKLRVVDLVTLIDLFGATPFSTWDVQAGAFNGTDPAATFAFHELATSVQETGFKASVLEYILQGTLPADSKIGLDPVKARATAQAIRATFFAIAQSHPDNPPSPLTADALTGKLALTFAPEIVTRFMSTLQGTERYESIADPNQNIVIPEPLAAKFTYVRGSGRLIATGVMTDAEQAALQGLGNASFTNAVNALHAEPEAFVRDNFGGIFTNLNEALATLLDHPAQAPAKTLEERLAYVYAQFVPVLKNKLRRDAISQQLAALIGLSAEASALLVAADADVLVADLSTEGFSATYFTDPAWTIAGLDRVDGTIDFAWGVGSPDGAIPADQFSVRWDAWIAAPASGEYTLIVDVAEADEAFRLYLDGALILEKPANGGSTSMEVVTTLNAAGMHALRLEYAEDTQNAGARLRWKTTTSAPEIIPSSEAWPAAILDRFVALAGLHHRAAKFITGFALTATELAHLLQYGADFENFDVKALTAAHWTRVRDYVLLRDAAAQAQARITDVLAAANTADPVPTVLGLNALVHQATAWDEASIAFLSGYFALGVNDYKNEIALNRVRKVMEIVARTGLSAETITEWGTAETDYDALHVTAGLLSDAVKGRYQEAEWLEVAGSLSDAVRRNQQQALIAYLLTRPAIRGWGARDADGLFEYFLIDVQMGACMDTSRIVQANSSIQMFVNRCLLNLESVIAGGNERGVAPSAIDKDRWEWMQRYRVWEANRKVFLYPENWLEPEWRNDRSPLFRELESFLVQNDITDRTVEQAFRNYLAGLNELANLEVCGMASEYRDDDTLKYLHVFGRTHNAPYKYFYRRWDQYRKWTAWEKMPVAIRASERAARSGVHLMPVVWKKRLFVFWPEFQEQQTPPDQGSKSAEEAGSAPMSELKPIKTYEIRLAWSEYVDDKWTAKQISNDFIVQEDHWYIPNESHMRFATEIDPENNHLHLWLLTELTDRSWYYEAEFELIDITARPRAESDVGGSAQVTFDTEYRNLYLNIAAWDPMRIKGKTYLKAQSNHKLLFSPRVENFDYDFTEPFFFSDPERSYFVRPVRSGLSVAVRHPDRFAIAVPTKRARPEEDPTVRPPRGHQTSGGSVAANRSTVRRSAMATRTTMPPATADTAGITAARTGASPNAFAGATYNTKFPIWLREVLGLEFHTFSHPYSTHYVTALNELGVPGLMQQDTKLPSDNGKTFKDVYDPHFSHGRVKVPSDLAKRTYYKENVCFDRYGANALYNWELFFHAPLYIATRLSRNGKYREAMQWLHYIFDPTTDEKPTALSETARYWKVLPFRTTPAENLEDWFRELGPNANPDHENSIIGEWRDKPFDPHVVAANRPLAYMKHVVIRYVENLVAWADSLFRQDTMETVNEALQIYVMANHILGPRPELVPRRGEVKAETYKTLEKKWDDFSNALVELENLFPYSSEGTASSSSPGSGVLGVGSALYFCIPSNDKLMEQWDTVADRLYKIRHCQNIDGVERKLALFSPPIDPGALIAAASKGLSLGSILADLSSPPPIYRFTFLIQKANDFCNDVRALGSSLLATLEKKDGEELSRLRAAQETQMLELVTAVRERQVLEARANREQLEKGRQVAQLRIRYYTDLLGNDTVAIPGIPSVPATLEADSELPADTLIPTVAVDVDVSLAKTDERGVKILKKEKESLDKNDSARNMQIAAGVADTLAAVLGLFPQLDAEGTPLGVGAGAWWGGQNLGAATSATGRALSTAASAFSAEAAQAATMASYIRREQDWTFQVNAAAADLVQIDKQIVAADIRIQIAEKELANHKQQIENAKAMELFLQDKFTNQELYQWMKEQLFDVYKQSYNLAYEMAKKAEKAYRYEIGTETSGFVQYGYWEDSKQGLVSGEKLQLALRQMERSYLDENRRELELSKRVSLLRLDPLALLKLRQTGRCFLNIPEELFDFDFLGHYYRRIQGVRVTIPCVAGPYTSVNCSLRLLNNSVRVNTTMNGAGNYEHENDEGVWIDDDRFRSSHVPVTAIATSSGQSDSGMFEFNFRDDRYLPFEGAGAISGWQLELMTEPTLRQFDYDTIADVILQIDYTARESGGLFRQKATDYLTGFLTNAADLAQQPLLQMFSMKHEFPSEWYRFLHPAPQGAEQILALKLGQKRFPFFAQDRQIIITRMEVFAKSNAALAYHARLSHIDDNDQVLASAELTLPQSAAYNGLNKVTLNGTDAGLDLEVMAIDEELTLRLKRTAVADYTQLDPEEVEDVVLVLHYKLG